MGEQAEESKSGEIITINVGGGGVGLGQSLIEQYSAEQDVPQFNSRSLFIDMDPYTINTLKNTYSHSSLLNESCLINGQHDASNNYAMAYLQTDLMTSIGKQLTNISESCDNLQGFVINHSLSGGCGSGLTALILEFISNNFQKKTIGTFCVMHDETFLSHPAQVYNACLMSRYRLTDLINYSV